MEKHQKKLIARILTILLLATFSQFTSAMAEDSGQKAGDRSSRIQPLFQVSSALFLRYDGRFLSDSEGEDSKLFVVADVTVQGARWDHVRFVVSGDLGNDLDGAPAGEIDDRTATIFDTWDSTSHGYLYQAYGELYRLGFLESSRIGRQYIVRDLPAHVDGLFMSFGSESGRFRVFGYGGIPVQFFDESPSGDSTQAGGGMDLFLATGTSFSFDYQWTDEKGGLYSRPETDPIDQASLRIGQRIGESGKITLGGSVLDNEFRQASVSALFFNSENDFDVVATYVHQPLEIDAVPSIISPFSYLMGPVKPYQDARLSFSKGLFASRVTLGLGGEWRQVLDDLDVSEFNRSFHHEFLSLTFSDLGLQGVDVTVHGDSWQNSDEASQAIQTGGGEVSYNRQKLLTLRAGMAYSLFKYDYYEDVRETTDVYTYYADARWTPLSWLLVGARYELDVTDIMEHHVVVTIGHLM